EAVVRAVPPRRGGGPGVRRGALDRRVPRVPGGPAARALGGGGRRRRLGRPLRGDRRGVGAPRPADPRRAHRQRRTRRRAQHRGAARAGRPPRVPRLRRRAAGDGTRLARRGAGGVGLGLRDGVGRVLAQPGRQRQRRPPGGAALDAEAAPTAPAGCARRGAPGDPRGRLRLEQALPPLLVGRLGPHLARGDPLRGPAHHHARLPVGDVRRALGDDVPLAHPRGVDHADASHDRGPARPLGDQARLPGRRPRPRVRAGGARLRRPGPRRRPVALLPARARLHRRVVGAAAHGGAGALERALAGPQRAAARAPARRLAGGAGPAGRRDAADAVGRRPRRSARSARPGRRRRGVAHRGPARGAGRGDRRPGRPRPAPARGQRL
ncbi:MAG: Beta-1,3-glucosyltransferase, partial [uncultured Nocardioides sp.]